MYCEKCNMEYNDDSTVCKLCGKKLVEIEHILDDEDIADLEAVSTEQSEDIAGSAPSTPEEIVDSTAPQLLITVADTGETEHITELLEANFIPVLVKQNTDFEGTDGSEVKDIFVPAELLPDALELINDIVAEEDDPDEELSDEELDRLLEELADETSDEDA